MRCYPHRPARVCLCARYRGTSTGSRRRGPILGAAFSIAATLAVALVAAPAQAAADPAADWAQAGLADQYELGSELPLINAPFVGTHNSFNSAAEMGPTLSAQFDPNQEIDLVAQLELGMRSLEIDAHRFFSVQDGGFGPVICHATGPSVGCTAEKSLDVVLGEISGWLRLPENRAEVLLLYVEDHLEQPETYDDAAAAIERNIGDLVYRPLDATPTAGTCTELPATTLTRNEIRAAGRQVVIVTDCGIGTAWQSLVFTWVEHLENRPFGFEDFPSCGPDYSREDYSSRLIRYYEDSTELTKYAGDPDDGITPETAAAMARCGVDLIGLDMIVPGDPRFEALVWSWGRGEPNGDGRCVLMVVGKGRELGRWRDRDCREINRPAACLIDGGWSVVKQQKATGTGASRVCRRRGGVLGVPRTGFENQELRLAMQRHGVKSAWLGYRLADTSTPSTTPSTTPTGFAPTTPYVIDP